MDPVSVLIVDDSALMRNLVSRIVEADPNLSVAGTAMNGKFALQKMERLVPDVIILDIEMPEMNGLEFLAEKKRLNNTTPVVILSSLAARGAQVTMEALGLGASDFIMKPSGSVSHDIHVVGAQLVELLKAYGTQYRFERGTGSGHQPPQTALRDVEPSVQAASPAVRTATPVLEPKAPPGPAKPEAEPGPLEIIAIGISTGGPNALRYMLAEIDPEIGLPIVVVQHMPPGFTAEFARSLDRICPLEVKEAADGDVIKPGRVLIAPGDRHLTVECKRLATVARLLDTPARNGHRPSVDVLFESIATGYGKHALAVIMTGMGRDGAEQIGEIYKKGGLTIGQDEASSIVYGMPRVAAEKGVLHQQVSLTSMAETLSALTKQYRQER
jgi:two-component system, chemotaxis family, protein-glutamate methylesterase/glutaminase